MYLNGGSGDWKPGRREITHPVKAGTDLVFDDVVRRGKGYIAGATTTEFMGSTEWYNTAREFLLSECEQTVVLDLGLPVVDVALAIPRQFTTGVTVAAHDSFLQNGCGPDVPGNLMSCSSFAVTLVGQSGPEVRVRLPLGTFRVSVTAPGANQTAYPETRFNIGVEGPGPAKSLP